MHEIGFRFERAALAGRWSLATYDLVELGEVFEHDLTTASWKGNATVIALSRSFATSVLPNLQASARGKDPGAFESQFAAAAHACNDCHRITAMSFIVIPEVPGGPVPSVDAPEHR